MNFFNFGSYIYIYTYLSILFFSSGRLINRKNYDEKLNKQLGKLKKPKKISDQKFRENAAKKGVTLILLVRLTNKSSRRI